MGEINEVEIGMENENNQSSNPKTSQKVECNVCGRLFSKPKSMANHRRWHNPIFRDKLKEKLARV